jgi:hypothetical protein
MSILPRCDHASNQKRNPGFVQIRRGLLTHLRGMSGNAVKLYLWLHLSAYWFGPKRGCVEVSYDGVMLGLGWYRKLVQRCIRELVQKSYIQVTRAANQHEVTTIKILRFNVGECDSGEDTSVSTKNHAEDRAEDSAQHPGVPTSVPSSPSISQNSHGLQAHKKAVEGIEGVEVTKKPAAAYSLNPWKAIGMDLPMGNPKFQKIFEHYFVTRNGNPLSDAMERTIQMANKEEVTVPGPFFGVKRKVERLEKEELAAFTVSAIPELEAEPWAR